MINLNKQLVTLYTIGHDIGSSSIKVALVNHNTGKKVVVRQEPESEMDILAPQPNWAEQDPEVWWKHICNGTQKIIKYAALMLVKSQQ